MHRTIFTRRFFGTEKNRHRENCTHRIAPKKYTPNFCTQKLYPEQFLHSRNSSAQKPLWTDFLNAQQFLPDGFYTENSPHRSLTHGRFYAQHFLHTDAFIHRNLCTQQTFTRNQLLHREVLLLLHHLPFVFPLSSDLLPPALRVFLLACVLFFFGLRCHLASFD